MRKKKFLNLQSVEEGATTKKGPQICLEMAI